MGKNLLFKPKEGHLFFSYNFFLKTPHYIFPPTRILKITVACRIHESRTIQRWKSIDLNICNIDKKGIFDLRCFISCKQDDDCFLLQDTVQRRYSTIRWGQEM